ncbi:Alpha/Beta hydrolase protein [Desarmillaria tabescens]|uniref:Alpha/Beta hydrolase protein n=1 Tax=Armillaria tabescens TaxID=1929756 RepID=A0AA39JAG6_ARMTA|nr:Alpha/Beta hydrolase protein [Desarmillaria tabescens]KAK0437128.1 Alpha/Beta hydrolase protein [Desarmillaria tabescens]
MHDKDSWPELSQAGQTIVKLRDGNTGDIPLIIIHGGGGAIHAFGPLQHKFRSALWALQVTPDTPLTTVDEQAKFYYYKIKSERRTGPYRLAAFSASSIIGFALTRILERNGDKVIQLALIDHFPTTFLAPALGVDVTKMPLQHPRARKEFIDTSFDNLVTIIRRDGGGNVLRRHRLADGLSDARKGLPTAPFIQSHKDILDRFLNQVFDFILVVCRNSEMPASEIAQRGSGQKTINALEEWLQSVNAPVSIYLGSYGMIGSVPVEHRKDWYDLGIHRCFPSAKVIHLRAGHYDILDNDVLIKSLQDGFIPSSRL